MNHRFVNTLLIIAVILLTLLAPGQLRAREPDPGGRQNDTMLMFVGEDLEVLSIASRRRQSAWQAPAVARVITREDIHEKGIQTVSHALAMEPGFYMAQKEWGSQPYLRGIADSVLFLYDTVPTGSDISKSIHPLDNELSLAPIKRIEILRGPGSVLWGADAFAGIVNLVPLTGKDLDGFQGGVIHGSPNGQRAVYANVGHDAGMWDAFLSISGRTGEESDTAYNLVRFWQDDGTAFPPEERFGYRKPDDSRYFEVSGNFSFGDWLTVSGLCHDYKKKFVLAEPDKEIAWQESRGVPYGFIKLEAKKNLDAVSALRFAGSYSLLTPQYEIIDTSLEQKEKTVYGEIIYDRSFLAGRGLFTGGFSYRDKHIEDAPIWDGYLPDYLGENNFNLVPGITEKDYSSGLWSVFGQYNQKIGNFDLWAGLRNDAHDEYGDYLSYNLGTVWSPESQWMVKLLYGVAYRTPFARQLLLEDIPDMEEIRTMNLQVAWRPSSRAEVSVCGFVSRIENHIKEDPYAGLSLPNHQDIQGMEIEGHFSPVQRLDFAANLTLLDNDGPDETYHWNDFSYVRPDGTVEKHYTDLNYPYNSGPDRLFNFSVTWQPTDRISAFLRLGYFDERDLIFARSEEIRSVPGVWLLDASTTIRDIGLPGLDLEITVRNLLDKSYQTPGTYSLVEGDPATLWVELRKKW